MLLTLRGKKSQYRKCRTDKGQTRNVAGSQEECNMEFEGGRVEAAT
jgi:hypothetical protein